MEAAASIIVPIKNRLDYVKECIDSIAAQETDAWGAILVDDSSDEATFKFLKATVKSDSRFKLIRNDGKPGANACRNLGIRHSMSPYLIFLDSDDILAPFCVKERFKIIETISRKLDFLVFAHNHFIKKPGDCERPWTLTRDEDHINRFLEFRIPWQTAGPIWKRDFLYKLGPWDESLACGQDWDFHMRALCLGAQYDVVNRMDFYHRLTVGRKDAISSQPLNKNRLNSHFRMLLSAQQQIQNSGLFNKQRSDFLLRLYWILANQWKVMGNRDKACEVWNLARTQRLSSQWQWRFGFIGLRLPSNIFVRKGWNMVLKIGWSRTRWHRHSLENF